MERPTVLFMKVHNSFFGGHMRTHAGMRASGRYNVGYRHWIEGCQRHGAYLYLGQIQSNDRYTIDEVENYLIYNYPSELNKKRVNVSALITLEHTGGVPECLRN
jgi:hypothetical protein